MSTRPAAGSLGRLFALAALATGVCPLSPLLAARTTAAQGKATFAGHVLDASGTPLTGARIRLVRIADSSVYISRPANRAGEFRMERLPGGRYAVHVLWARTRQVYPWVPDLDLGSDATVSRVLRIRLALPEPYPGDDAWEDWNTKRSDANGDGRLDIGEGGQE